MINSEDQPAYLANKSVLSLTEKDIIESALRVLQARLRQPGESMTSPEAVSALLTLRMAELEHEVFACLFLDNQHRVIELEELFRGTIDGAAVYPREVAKRALHHNAAAVIFAHNHPSGISEPSQADRQITDTLKQALALFDIRVLDHFIIGGMSSYSFAKHGLI